MANTCFQPWLQLCYVLHTLARSEILLLATESSLALQPIQTHDTSRVISLRYCSWSVNMVTLSFSSEVKNALYHISAFQYVCMAWCFVNNTENFLKRLVAGFPPRWSELELRSGHVGFLVDKVTVGQVFSGDFNFPCQFSFHRQLHIHRHL
jgi:hypothetical protein